MEPSVAQRLVVHQVVTIFPWERFSSSGTRSKEYPSLITHYNDCFFLDICPQPVEIQQNHYDPCRSSSYRPFSLANSI
jgi:hypothetical protein